MKVTVEYPLGPGLLGQFGVDLRVGVFDALLFTIINFGKLNPY